MTYQDQKYKFVFLCIIFILGLSFQLNNYGHAEDTHYNNEIFQISIVLDGYDISEAVDKSTAILIDPEKGVMVNLNARAHGKPRNRWRQECTSGEHL